MQINKKSLEDHQIKGQGISGFSLPVILQYSDNEYLKYPVNGVIQIYEQSTDLKVNSAVFYQVKFNGDLGPPVEVKNPIFTYNL